MTTKNTISDYFRHLKQGAGWESFLDDDMVFTSFATPIKQVTGRAAYLESTKRFYSMIRGVDVRSTIVDGDHACALTRYDLQPPGGPLFQSDVAEVFKVRDGKITSFDIYFDSSPFPKAPAVNNNALSVVRAYHRGWTTRNFDEATRLLSADLRVEVPINHYPTSESFAKAVVAFGGLTKHVDLLAEFGHDDQAMLLYDMDVEGLGTMRVAEHFTIDGGRITRIRQVHDTAALRAAGFGDTT